MIVFEKAGLQAVPSVLKTRGARDLFWVWFAGNLGILGVLFGAIIVSFSLAFWEAVIVGLIGSLSFLLVGLLSTAGRDAGQPMMALSARVFGDRGNMLMALLNWVNLLGWEAVAVLTGTFALQAVLGRYVFIRSPWILVLCGVVFLIVFLILSLYGYHLVVRAQKFIGYVFGILTLVVLIALISHHTVGTSFTVKSTPNAWWQGGLAAISFMMAGTSISWAMASSDYSRYLSIKVRTRSILLAVTLGGGIPLFALVLTGILLAYSAPQILASSNPIQALSTLLPAWMQVPYLIVVIVGLLAEAVLGFYSSGFSLLALGIRAPRPQTAWIDFVVSLLVLIYGVFHSSQFLGLLEGFLSLMGVGLAAWAGVFLVEKWKGHAITRNFSSHYRWNALSAWCVATCFGLMFTSSPIFTGPFATGIFAQSSFGVILALLIGGVVDYAYLYSRR